MGCRLVALAHEDPALDLVCALEWSEHPRLGEDAGVVAGCGQLGVPLVAEIEGDVEAMIDFSVPQGATSALNICQKKRLPLVLATTGLDVDQQQLVQQTAEIVPVVCAPNMSLAVNLSMKLTEIAARALKNHPGGVDVEILERHHRFKEDSPSGTALKFGQIVANEMGQSEHRHGRHGIVGKRSLNEIGYHAIRVGDNPGEHNIVFGLLGETVEIRVAATNRDCYAQGALAAAKFIAGQKPGLYDMFDVLGI